MIPVAKPSILAVGGKKAATKIPAEEYIKSVGKCPCSFACNAHRILLRCYELGHMQQNQQLQYTCSAQGKSDACIREVKLVAHQQCSYGSSKYQSYDTYVIKFLLHHHTVKTQVSRVQKWQPLPYILSVMLWSNVSKPANVLFAAYQYMGIWVHMSHSRQNVCGGRTETESS